MSDCWMMLHTLPSIQPAVNWPTVKHAGPASRCHTWRFWPQIKTQWTSLLLSHLTLSSRQLSYKRSVRPPLPPISADSQLTCMISPPVSRHTQSLLLIKLYFGLSKHHFIACPMGSHSTSYYERNQSGSCFNLQLLSFSLLICLFCCEYSCCPVYQLLFWLIY